MATEMEQRFDLYFAVQPRRGNTGAPHSSIRVRPALELRPDVHSMLHFLLAASLAHDLPFELMRGALQLTGCGLDTTSEEGGVAVSDDDRGNDDDGRGHVVGGAGSDGTKHQGDNRDVFDPSSVFKLPTLPRAELAALLATLSDLRDGEGGASSNSIYPRLRACLTRIVARAFRKSLSVSPRRRRAASAVTTSVVDARSSTSLRGMTASNTRARTARDRTSRQSAAVIGDRTALTLHADNADERDDAMHQTIFGNLLEVSAARLHLL